MRGLPSDPGATAPPASEPPVATLDEALAQALAKARQCHQAGQLRAAEELYRAILQAQPGHAAANHGLGLLEVERAQPSAGLPHFIAALEADPQSPHHWLAYIDALLRSGQAALAREVLALGEQHGLDGAEVERLRRELARTSIARGRGNKAPRGRSKQAAARAATDGPGATEVDAVIALYQRGEYAAGEVAARCLTERHPQDGRGWKILGALLKAQGDDGQALLAMRRAVELLPDDEQVRSNLGLVLADLGQLAEAEGCHRRALAIRDDFAEAHYNLGNTLLAQRRHADAAISYQRATELRPDLALAHCNLGNALMGLDRLPEAEAAYQRALALQANLADAHNNLGRSLKAQGRLPEAETSYRRALALRPDYPEAFSNLGEVLTAQGRLGEGETALRQALLHKPDLAAAHYNLGNNLDEQNHTAEAESAWQSAIDCQPDFPEAMVLLAASLRARNRLDDAEALLRQAIAYHPDLAIPHYNLGNVFKQADRLDEAEASYRSAIALAPDLANAHLNLGVVLTARGRYTEADAALRRAIQLKPDSLLAHSNLLYSHSHDPAIDAATLFAEHRRFGEMIEAPLCDTRQPHDNRRDPERRMQIGLVSGDFRNHAVANFIEPVLAELSGYQSVTLHAYYNHAHEDHVTQRLRQHFAHWQHVADLSDAELAKRIRADGIDILIDLSGHTAHNRLLTFAHKPAPIQASWIGYPGTTGLQSIDYFFADRHFLPAGEFDGQFTEQIVRLPASAPFLPFADAPDIAPLPALSRGHLTFGSFNRPTKIGPQVVALWSRLLRAVPEAKMLLGAMRPDRNAERLADEFAANGVARERLVFRPRCDMPTYLALYQQVDICLDTFPYTGGTTTLHACWMGVPTLTIAGRTVPGRAAASTLGHVGLPGFIAHDACEFVARGSEWAADPGQLAALRAGLRERLQQSALGRPGLVAAGLEGALRIIWQRWCQGLATGSFEVGENDLSARAAP
ncbi:tetratricopeptide repeat protein [Accumulibacter sp.]|jgi:protein O-GlcNAc transferase|uniref:tetratricopeptide repeat protein n=1 Tax=Accumulibacter sp. TaxID=2053492 RepID=UPI001ACFD4A6|nr:tetratricopeptide repeat protein [Accumulibacter sp.]MBN8456138.1 tetratricopeptide repeat protein [Accumulibacter sp.]